MHIPDGYLSPATCVVLYGAALPFWYRASQRVQNLLRSQSAPLVAIFAAFVFTIQMFNIPVPGGTTAHPVGGTLMAVVVGPWAAILGVSVALVIQAFFFADGGITALGANAFNLGIALPLVGYAVYRLLARGASPTSRRRALAGALGAYAGINVAALLAGLELGIQPLIASVDGRALYNPYGLSATLPAMALTHLTVAGFAEAAVTGLAIAYLQRSHPGLLGASPDAAIPGRELGRSGWALVGAIVVLAFLAPLGLLAPGVADFEWGTAELQGLVGYAPEGLVGLSGLWSWSPFPDYQLPGQSAPAGYVLSAVFGAALIFVLIMAVRVALARAAARAR